MSCLNIEVHVNGDLAHADEIEGPLTPACATELMSRMADDVEAGEFGDYLGEITTVLLIDHANDGACECEGASIDEACTVIRELSITSL